LINKPERVVIGKSIARRYAILFHVFLSSLGILLSFILNWKIGCLNTLCVFFLWLYSNNLKRQPFIGNLTVALLTGLSIALVDFIFTTQNTLIIIYSLFAFFMTLVREIVKDIEDMKGDTNFGCKTLPIVWGIRKTKWLLYLLISGFSIAILFIHIQYSLMPALYFIIFLIFPMIVLIMRLIKADTKREFYRLSQLCKLIMLLGIFSMVLI
jgi:4-hydroxybenzoate polyprenyltransferase